MDLQRVNSQKKMTSREIAELTGKEHFIVMRDTRSLINQGAIGAYSFVLSSYTSEQNKELPMYHLDFKATMTLITGYDATRRAKVINRWVDLENGDAVPTHQLPQSYPEALRALADESEKTQRLLRQIEEDSPKVDLANAITQSDKAIEVGTFVKAVSERDGVTVGRNKFYHWLRAEGILMYNNIPYQPYIDNGWFEVIQDTYENIGTNGPRLYYKTLVRNQVALYNRFKKSEYYKTLLQRQHSDEEDYQRSLL